MSIKLVLTFYLYPRKRWKARPAPVIHSDLFAEYPFAAVLPITSDSRPTSYLERQRDARRTAFAVECQAMSTLLSSDWLVKRIRRPQRAKVVPKDVLAEEGNNLQSFQIETAFYFTLPGAPGSGDEIGYYGGHLRSLPLSDSEAHRLLPRVLEDAPIEVRYNPADPNQTHTLAADNPNALPFPIWPN
jgi:hypothetical protein